MSEEAYDINKQTTYIAPKLKIESRVKPQSLHVAQTHRQHSCLLIAIKLKTDVHKVKKVCYAPMWSVGGVLISLP